MRFCPKCGELYDDQLLGFCLADGTPLGAVTPDSDVWKEGSRLFEQKQNALKTQQRKLKWRRAVLTTMLIATMAVCIAAVSRSIYVTVDPPQGKLCIATFNDLNGDGKQDAGESGVSGFVFQVRGTDSDKTLTTDIDGRVCSDLPIGSYTILEQLQGNAIATTPTTQTVTLTSGQTANPSFGSRQETELCIGRFEDLNGNGRREEDEPGLSGFVFQVSGPGVSTTLTTGQSGVDCIVIPVGTYTVVERPQSGWVTTTDTKQTVTVTAGGVANVLLGSKRELGKLCITTFDDSNNNRSRDAGEVGLSGVVFQVRGQSSAITLRADPDGICSDLPVGSYTVVEQTPDGWVATTPTTHAVTISAGQTKSVSFGARRETGKLCVTAFDDLNGDGARDAGERGLSGFVFQVSGTGAAATLITNANVGACSDFPVGAYTVTEQPQGGWTATTTPTVTVTIRKNQTEKLAFGSRQQAGTLCIKKFDDRNANRTQDKDEPGLPNFEFQINGTDLHKTLTTDSKGEACWPLPVGAYTVDEQQQRGWIATTLTTQKVIILPGRTAKPLLFGSRREASKLCITTFYDKNRNRKQDKDEPGLAGIAFQVSGAGDVKMVTTDVDGTVCLPLAAGSYTVAETPTPGWTPTTPTKLNTVIKQSQTFGISFGNTKSEPECSETDKSREWQIILNQYESNWRQNIEGERNKIIAENVPRDSKVRYEISLGRIKPQHVFRNCATVTVVLTYAWQIDFFAAGGKKSISRERSYLCEKTAAGWICSK